MRARLSSAGLGEKKISIFLHGDAEDFHHEFIHYFPKLSKGRGYELLRCSNRGGRELILIDRPKTGYTPQYVKSVICSAKIYIRPLQKDLDLSHSNEAVVLQVNVSGLFGIRFLQGVNRDIKQECQTCGSIIPMNQLKEHLAECLNEKQLVCVK